MKVYTFSTGGCRDGFYLDKLSTTKEGVIDFIKKEIESKYCKVIDFLIIEEDSEIFIDVEEFGDIEKRVFELVIFEVV